MKRILSCLALLLILASGCNSGNSSGNPKNVLSNFFTALSNKNIDEAKKYVTSDSEGMLNMMQMGLQHTGDSKNADMFDPKNIVLGDPVISGDEATVPVTEKSSNETLNFILQKEKGNWKVAFDFSTLARMAQQKMKEKGITPGQLDSAMGNISKEDMEKAKSAIDSLTNKMGNASPEKLKDAAKLLDSLKNLNH